MLTYNIRYQLERGLYMRYPKFLEEKNTVGIVAPSFGAASSPYFERYKRFPAKFLEYNLNVKFAKYVEGITYGESAPKELRANDFMQMYQDPKVDFVLSLAGGEREIEILPYIDFELIKRLPPKFFMGYSDNTNLTYTLTTIADCATIYGVCATDFGIDNYDNSRLDHLNLMFNKTLKHRAYPLIEVEDIKHEQPMSAYNLTQESKWLNLNDEKEIILEGRLIGGCLDTLVCLCGTPYDNTLNFCNKYQEDGIIFFLENCELNPFQMLRALLQLKWSGWFTHCKGLIFGRHGLEMEAFDVDQKRAIKDALSDLNIPIIYNMDFGHVPPMYPIICGSYAKIINNEQESTIEYFLK